MAQVEDDHAEVVQEQEHIDIRRGESHDRREVPLAPVNNLFIYLVSYLM